MDYNKFNIEEKYDSYKNISIEKAKKILQKLEMASDEGNSYDFHLLRGKMLLKLDRLDEALKELESALKLDRTDEVYDLLSFGYYENGNYEKALQYINLSFGLTVDEYIYNHKGKILEKMERYEESFETYYNGLKFSLGTYSSYGDVEIFGENVGRIGALLKNNYEEYIKKYIEGRDYVNLYKYYMKLLKVISMEEENDHYHSVNGYVASNYLELIEAGKHILISNDCYLELIDIYKMLYEIEKNSEPEDRVYLTRAYIDDRVKELIESLVERTSLKVDEALILKVLNEVISLRNRDYYGYLYHKGFIYMKLQRYDDGVEIFKDIIDEAKCDYMTMVQSYECIIKSLRGKDGYDEVAESYSNKFAEFLLKENERIMESELIHLDEKWSRCIKNCRRAINLDLNHDFWTNYVEEISLKFGEEYETINKNQSAYKTIVNYNKAVEIYDKIIETNPKGDRGYYRKGRAMVLTLRLLNSSKTSLKDIADVRNLGCYTYSEVIYNLSKAISINSNNGKYYNLLARTHFEIGEYDKALNYITKSASMLPDELCVNLNLACVYIRKYQYTVAIDCLFKIAYGNMKVDKVTKTFLPKKEILDFLMGMFNIYKRKDKIYFIMAYYFYAIADNKCSRALTFINNAIEINDDERYYLLKAKIFYKEGKYKEALLCVDEAISIEEHYDEAYLLKEKCLAKLNESSTAKNK